MYRLLNHENGGVVLVGRNEAESVKLRTHAENRLRPMYNARRQEKSRFVPTGGLGWGVYFQSHEVRLKHKVLAKIERKRRDVLDLIGPS